MDKLAYLQNENEGLRSEILDLKQTISINKTEIDILSRQLQSNPQTKKLIDIIYGYRSRQQEMQEGLEKSKEEISKLSSDNLVLRQLNQQQSEQLKSLQKSNYEVIIDFQKRIKSLQQKLVFYEKCHKQYDKVSGFVLKNKQIFSPQEVVIELRNKEEQMNKEIRMMKNMVEEVKQTQQNLMIVNTVLRNKIVSLQAKLAVPNKHLGQVLDKSLKRLMLYFLEVQKKIVEGNEDSESDDEEDIELIAPELSGLFPEKKLRLQKDYGVPHLDLLKIRDQMQQNNSKIKEALIARNHLSDKQRIERLEIQLEYTRRELTRKIMDIKDEKEKRKKLQFFVSEINKRNELLVQSNRRLENINSRYWKKIQQKTKESQAEESFDESQQEVMKKEQTQPNKLNMLMESQIDFKIHLQLMAKQLQKNSKLSKLKDLKPIEDHEGQGCEPKLKRSNSNPFLYFNERRNQILQVHDEERIDDDNKIRLEQTYYAPEKKIGFEEVLDEIDI